MLIIINRNTYRRKQSRKAETEFINRDKYIWRSDVRQIIGSYLPPSATWKTSKQPAAPSGFVNDASAYSVTFLVALRTRPCVDEASVSVGNPGIVLMAESWSGLEKGHAHLTSRACNVKRASPGTRIRISSHLSNTSSRP